MKPVMQTITGIRGNCFSACVASILELSLEEVPNFFYGMHDNPSDAEWGERVRTFLRSRGLGIVCNAFTEPSWWNALGFEGCHIVSGPSPRIEGAHHATIWEHGKMIHDPHPDRTGIVKPETIEIIYQLSHSRS